MFFYTMQAGPHAFLQRRFLPFRMAVAFAFTTE
jgi:hypothetical protein